PVRLIGSDVRLRTDDGRLLVIMTGTGQVIAEHVLVAPGEASVRDEHYGGPRPAPRRAVRPKTAAEKAFCALGPVAEAFITRAAAGPRPDRRSAQAETGRDAPARPGAAPDRQDPAVGTGGTAAHPGRGRDQRPRRLQRPHQAEERRVPGDQDPGGVRPGRLLR